MRFVVFSTSSGSRVVHTYIHKQVDSTVWRMHELFLNIFWMLNIIWSSQNSSANGSVFPTVFPSLPCSHFYNSVSFITFLKKLTYMAFTIGVKGKSLLSLRSTSPSVTHQLTRGVTLLVTTIKAHWYVRRGWHFIHANYLGSKSTHKTYDFVYSSI